MDATETKKDQDIWLDPVTVGVLRGHAESLPPGAIRESELLFPAEDGGFLSPSAFRRVFKSLGPALGLSYKVTPRAMRRSYQDLARGTNAPSLVVRSISGHATEQMQNHY